MKLLLVSVLFALVCVACPFSFSDFTSSLKRAADSPYGQAAYNPLKFVADSTYQKVFDTASSHANETPYGQAAYNPLKFTVDNAHTAVDFIRKNIRRVPSGGARVRKARIPESAPTKNPVGTTAPTRYWKAVASPTTPTRHRKVVASPTTPSPTTPSPTTPSPTSPSPTTPSPSTPSPTTPSPTTASPTTPSPTTPSPTTASPSTSSPTTASPSTASPTTASPTVVPSCFNYGVPLNNVTCFCTIARGNCESIAVFNPIEHNLNPAIYSSLENSTTNENETSLTGQSNSDCDSASVNSETTAAGALCALGCICTKSTLF